MSVSSVTSSASQQPLRPLQGIRIVDLTSVLFGPYASQFLGDYGADVIKVETLIGDSTRRTGEALQPGLAVQFMSVNRNKRSIALDLKRADGRAALQRIIDGADVVMHNIRPQKLAGIGLDPAALRARNPRLIFASLIGFSESGPYAGRPAYDDIIQGLCGLADLMQRQSGEPRFLPTVAADKVCAMIATHAILAALMERARSGEGSDVEVSMFESMVGFTMIEHLSGQTFDPPTGTTGYSRALAPSRRPYRTQDGYLCVMPYTDDHWRRFFEGVGRSDLAADARFSDMPSRTRNIEVLYALTGGLMAEHTTAHWLEFLQRVDIPHGRVNTLDDLLTDPHLHAVGFFRHLPAGQEGSTVRIAANGVRLNGETATVRTPPRLGEHTREVLAQAGLTATEIEALITSGTAHSG